MITSISVTENSLQGSERHITLRMTDHVGVIHTQRTRAIASDDITALLRNIKASFESALLRKNVNDILKAVESGRIVPPLVHCTIDDVRAAAAIRKGQRLVEATEINGYYTRLNDSAEIR